MDFGQYRISRTATLYNHPLFTLFFSVVFKQLPCYYPVMISRSNTPSFSAAISYSRGDKLLQHKAEQLAATMHLPVIEEGGKRNKLPAVLLFFSDKGLELQSRTTVQGKLYIDFLSDSMNYRKQHGGGIKQALARAVGIKANIRPSILDATAGLGIDSYLLAGFGCEVRMIERSPFLAALLQDGLERAALDNPMLLHGEAIPLIAQPENRVDTIYLDPMYPHRSKSALNKQEMRIIRELVGDDDDADQVFLTAIEHAAKRVVVKRPKGAPFLARRQPSHSIKMKNSRFDVYM